MQLEITLAQSVLTHESPHQLFTQANLGDNDVTIKKLLNMSSGIYNYFEDQHYENDLSVGFLESWDTEFRH